MSVTISRYCRTNDNKLVKRLKRIWDAGTFMSDTLMDVVRRDDEWWCDFLMDYTLTCNDLAQLAESFEGLWWYISPFYGNDQYRVSVCLGSEEL